MTVTRQYTLPYCNLVLEGMESIAFDPYSPMTVLMNAECQFPGVTDTTLTGGREFLESLVAAVSAYGQHLLSGIPRPVSANASLVDLKPGEGNLHHLVVRQQPGTEPAVDTEALAPLDIPLTTVQFYDLMEAVDQLLADGLTLPDLKAQFQAVPRRLVKPAEPMAQRSAPAVVGAAALVAAGLALFFMPPPEFDPSRLERREATETLAPTDTQEALESWEDAPTITDAVVLTTLRRDLQQRLQEGWTAAEASTEDLVYRVVVSETGEILGYKYENDAALEAVDSTPLAQVAVPTPGPTAPQQAVAQFLARFTPAGDVEVEVWDPTLATEDEPQATENGTLAELPPVEDAADETANQSNDDDSPTSEAAEDAVPEVDSASDSTSAAARGNPPPASSGRAPQALATLDNRITDGNRIRTLNGDLRAQLSSADLPDTRADLIYQVRLDSRGNVVGYNAINTDALLLAQETPLPELVTARPASADQADFRVVFTARGVIEVSPWDGWPR
ncbi:hypothetical protein GFS31_06090 [Leptolyngbya sp. BL0902]|uniref:DUF4335 domain-containing protein n=1 Tax=Leptolyngbya sp. BL0902 TaxID=1115757 RepID=UPI0018E77BFE|nr:DUF4335 domain-containing protein [Leptolyngbya sp. BL0902]QQE63938.1 hypothetical protein GFS31_06090 [Leptolyngbya sp. BL0902]